MPVGVRKLGGTQHNCTICSGWQRKGEQSSGGGAATLCTCRKECTKFDLKRPWWQPQSSWNSRPPLSIGAGWIGHGNPQTRVYEDHMRVSLWKHSSYKVQTIEISTNSPCLWASFHPLSPLLVVSICLNVILSRGNFMGHKGFFLATPRELVSLQGIKAPTWSCV